MPYFIDILLLNNPEIKLFFDLVTFGTMAELFINKEKSFNSFDFDFLFRLFNFERNNLSDLNGTTNFKDIIVECSRVSFPDLIINILVTASPLHNLNG